MDNSTVITLSLNLLFSGYDQMLGLFPLTYVLKNTNLGSDIWTFTNYICYSQLGS